MLKQITLQLVNSAYVIRVWNNTSNVIKRRAQWRPFERRVRARDHSRTTTGVRCAQGVRELFDIFKILFILIKIMYVYTVNSARTFNRRNVNVYVLLNTDKPL